MARFVLSDICCSTERNNLQLRACDVKQKMLVGFSSIKGKYKIRSFSKTRLRISGFDIQKIWTVMSIYLEFSNGVLIVES